MRLGGPLFDTFNDPSEWIRLLRQYNYGAAYCPVPAEADDATVNDYIQAARKAGVVIAEVGAWSNPLSTDGKTREAALNKCKAGLALAERTGARCCVNISGSRGEQWDGPHPDNFTPETFDLIVEVVRDIIDSVKPRDTFYTLETMPWMYPDSADSYLELIRAIDRRQFAVHLDPVNLICSPQRYFANATLIRECFQKLGPYIQSCHAKDILLGRGLTTHLDEVRPGCGVLDYPVFLRELSRLDRDTPLMMEHLPSAEESLLAGEYIRSVAGQVEVEIVSI